jgi:phosphate:Na+ symporter
MLCGPPGRPHAQAPSAPAPAAQAPGLPRLERLLAVPGSLAAEPNAGQPGARHVQVRALQADGQPAPGVAVRFFVIAAPAGALDVTLQPALARTDARGVAETHVALGTRPGDYAVGAALADASPSAIPLQFRFTVRDLRWWLGLVFGLLGGLAIFLFGMGLMSDGMKNVFGQRIRTLLASLTQNAVLAVAVGAFVTMVIQSSSATTVMLVGFVQARLMTFAQTLGIILGAHIGTTITAQIIAFRVTDYALLIVAGGFALMLVPGRGRWHDAGRGVLGFGLLFFGMQVMAEAMRPLSTYEPFVALIVALERPSVGILVGAGLTALIQSSSAFTGILIALASQGLLTLNAAIPLVLGANVGTSITAVLASLNTRREAKRVALAHTLFQVFGVVLITPFIAPFADLIRWISPADGAADGALLAMAGVVPRQIANAHTLFNVTMTLLFLPLVRPAARLITWLLPERPGEQAPFKAVYLNESMLATPSLALPLARSEVVRMGGLVLQMVQQCVLPFVEHRQEALGRLERMEVEVNFLQERIDDYLTDIARRNVTEPQVDEAFQLMYAVTELEQIADIVSTSVRPRAAEWLSFPRRFSGAGDAEIRDLHLRAVKQVARAGNLLRERSPERALRMREKYQKYRAMEIDFMRSHFQRLRDAVPESVATNEYHQELMEQLVRIISHATNIARILLEEEAPGASARRESGGASPGAALRTGA